LSEGQRRFEPGLLAEANRGHATRRAAARLDVILVATGSEVHLALAVERLLAARGVSTRVVSMPWRERFCDLPPSEQAKILPPGTPRLVVEAGCPQGWEGVAGAGCILGLRRFGASAPGPTAMRELGFDADGVAAAALALIGTKRR
jgi:transketolase